MKANADHKSVRGGEREKENINVSISGRHSQCQFLPWSDTQSAIRYGMISFFIRSPHLTPSYLHSRLPECLGETAAWAVLMGAGADVLSRQLSITSTVWA